MKKNYKRLQDRIDEFGKNGKWWYQPINFGYGIRTHSYKWDDKEFYNRKDFGENKWNYYIKPFLPFSLRDKIVLELGCNAGYFLVKSIKEGAKFAYGIEPSKKRGKIFDNGFYEQSQLVLDIYSELEEVDYRKYIKIFDERCDTFDWQLLDYKIDIVFAFNVLYWLTYSEEEGSINNAKIILQQIFDNIAKYSDYLLIIGDAKTEKYRKNKKLNSFCVANETTIPFLKNFDILTDYRESFDKVTGREMQILFVKSKKFRKLDDGFR